MGALADQLKTIAAQVATLETAPSPAPIPTQPPAPAPAPAPAPLQGSPRVVALDAYGRNSAGLAKAAAAAGAGGSVALGYGDIQITSSVVLTNVGLYGEGPDAATFIVTTKLGAGVPALDVKGGGSDVRFRSFGMVGPGGRQLGVKTGGCDGLRVTGQTMPHFADLKVRGFDAGFVLGNTDGHIHFRDCNITDNYYGVYISNNTYDYFFANCAVNGNTFANIGLAAVGNAGSQGGIAGASFRDCHMGFAPYAFYQEPGQPGQWGCFLQEVIFDHARFEQIGNAAFWTDAADVAGQQNATWADVKMRHVGFSWGTPYRIAGRPQTHALKLNFTQRTTEIENGPFGFTAGSAGVYRVERAAHSNWTVLNPNGPEPASNLSVGSGPANFTSGTRRGLA